jgi:hypothetical protein
MKDFYIYSVASGTCVAFTRMRGESRFDIYDTQTGQYISFANISGDRFYVYDVATGHCIENGRIDYSSNTVWFYNGETGSCDKFGKI